MSSFHIFHILLDNVFVSWQAHTVNGYQLWVVHRIPALECDCLACTWRDRPIVAVLLTGMPQYPWWHRHIVHLYWWPCLAIWFHLSCTSSGGGTDPAYRWLVGRVSRSYNHTAVSYNYSLIHGNLRFPGYVMHTTQALLELLIHPRNCSFCLTGSSMLPSGSA